VSGAGDAERWDARYRDPRWDATPACDAFVLEDLEALGAGAGRRALDAAAGTGRHALELAARGWRAVAWDVSPVGLERLAAAARARGLGVERRVVDLTGALPEERFDLILVVSYLDRALWPRLVERLAPGGHLLLTTFTEDAAEGPSARHCLRRGELAAGLAGLTTILHAERDGRAGLLGRVAGGSSPG